MSFDFSNVFDYGNFLDSLDSPFVLDLKNLVEASGLLTSSINSVDCLHSSDVFSSVNVSDRIAGDRSIINIDSRIASDRSKINASCHIAGGLSSDTAATDIEWISMCKMSKVVSVKLPSGAAQHQMCERI